MSTPAEEESPPYRTVIEAFSEVWDEDLSTLDVGKLLTCLSQRLGVVIAELNQRGVPWEVIDRNIQKSLLKGVDSHMK